MIKVECFMFHRNKDNKKPSRYFKDAGVLINNLIVIFCTDIVLYKYAVSVVLTISVQTGES